MTKGTISRRGFMKAAAATGAALTAAGSIPLLETTDQAFAAGSVERVSTRPPAMAAPTAARCACTPRTAAS